MAAHPGRSAGNALRLMSYNIRGGLGMDGGRSASRIADVVREIGPDAVCFQEVHQRLPWSGWVDQPRLLTQQLGGRVVFQRNINTLVGGYGLAVWTRLPILTVRHHFLPGGKERRGALEVAVTDSGRPVTLLCTHWGLTWDERERQAGSLAEIVRGISTPAVVCGDFNDVARAPYLESFLEQAGLRDCGREGDAWTYPSDAPEVRIDFICASPQLSVGPVQVEASQASDHLPLWADIN